MRTPGRHSLARVSRNLALACMIPSLAAAQALPQGVERVTEVEGITEYRLDNGLRVLLFPDPSAPQVTVNVTYFVGSRHEGYGETGMAHLLEHLVFKGTPDHPDIPQELTEHGAQPNGTTWYDRTNYFETFNATDENLEWALDLEADRMVNSFISKDDLDSEMTVVRNEFESGENSPFRVLMERTLSTAYLWHNYGQSTIGARSDIENVPIERLQAFYRKYYQPDNAMLVVAGRFDQNQLLGLVAEKFGAIPRPDRSDPGTKLYPTYTNEPDQDGERIVRLRRVGDTQLFMVSHHVAPGSHPDFAAISVLDFVLTDNPSGRLYEALVESGKAASVGSLGFQLREATPMVQMATVRLENDIEEAADIAIATLDSLNTDPVTEEEVNRAKTALLRNIELAFNDSRRIALELSEWAGMGDWRLFFIHRDRLGEVTAADVNRAASKYILPSNRTLGFFMPTESPQRAEIPDQPDVAAMVADYTGRSAVAAAEEFDPSPANVESRTDRIEVGETDFDVALLPKQTRGDQVVVSFRVLFGNEENLRGRTFAAPMAGGMLMRGTTSHTREELSDEFDRLNAQVGIGGGTTSASGSIMTTYENLPAVLELVNEVLHEPAFDASEFEQLREQRLAALESQRSEPTAIASLTMQRHMNPYPEDDPRYIPSLDEQIEGLRNVSVEEARQFHSEFYGATRGHMAIVGDFDREAVMPIVEQIFGDWVAEAPTERLGDRYFDVEPINETIRTPDKPNAFFIAGLNLPLSDSDPDYPALLMGNFMLGGGFLNSRLAVRIRQNEGISYSVASGISGHPIEQSGQFQAFAIYAPENVQKLEQAFMEELNRVIEEGFTAEELAAAKSGYLQSSQVSRGNDRVLAGQLSQQLYFERTMDWQARLESAMSELTVEQVNAAFRKWIDPSKLSIVKAGDFPGISN